MVAENITKAILLTEEERKNFSDMSKLQTYLKEHPEIADKISAESGINQPIDIIIGKSMDYGHMLVRIIENKFKIIPLTL